MESYHLSPDQLAAKRHEKTLLHDALVQAIETVRMFFDKNGEAATDSQGNAILNFMQKCGVFRDLPKLVEAQARAIIQERLIDYLKQRKEIASCRKRYENDISRLLQHSFQKTFPRPKAGTLERNAIWDPECVTLVLPNKIYDRLTDEKNGANRSAGEALLGGSGINICRHNTRWEIDSTHIHERDHQRNQFLRPEENPAQQEILAFMAENYGWTETIKALVKPDGIYDYFAKAKEAAKTPTEKDSIDRQWKTHCRRVVKGIQAAALLHGGRPDELSTTPLSQWGKLPGRPTKENFFTLYHNNSRYAPLIPPSPLEQEINRILRRQENQELVNKAGLGGPEGITSLLPKRSAWMINCTTSGVLLFVGANEVTRGLELVAIPSLAAIHGDKLPTKRPFLKID